MKTAAVCIVLLFSTVSVAGANCADLVAAVRPPSSEGDESRRYLESADQAYRDCRGAKVPLEIRAKALFKYGIANASRERMQASIGALHEAIDLLGKSDQTKLLIEVLDYTAFVESRAGLQSDATAHAKRAADVRAKTYGRNSAETAQGLVQLAMVHVTFNEFAKTETLLRDAIRIAEKACGPECDALVDAYAGMQTLYEAQGNTAEARKYAELGQNAVPSNRGGGTKD